MIGACAVHPGSQWRTDRLDPGALRRVRRIVRRRAVVQPARRRWPGDQAERTDRFARWCGHLSPPAGSGTPARSRRPPAPRSRRRPVRGVATEQRQRRGPRTSHDDARSVTGWFDPGPGVRAPSPVLRTCPADAGAADGCHDVSAGARTGLVASRRGARSADARVVGEARCTRGARGQAARRSSITTSRRTPSRGR